MHPAEIESGLFFTVCFDGYFEHTDVLMSSKYRGAKSDATNTTTTHKSIAQTLAVTSL